MIQRRTLLKSGAAAALAAPALSGFAQQAVTLKFHTFMSPQSNVWLSMLLLTIPIFFPMVMALDFGMPKESVAIWFGIMVLMTVGFGLIAPPVGLNVYIVNGMAKNVPMGETYRGVMPFLISDVFRTLLFLFFPIIPLWLVGFIK